ncbi:hypothetical protein BJX62DRAFT_238413 [Aspergillus germanicus]
MLCHTFSQLVEQLRGSVAIMFILKGELASSNVSEQWRDDFSDVLLIHNRLAANSALRFKLLCKAPFASCDRLTEQRFDVHYSLRLQPSAVSDDGGFIKRFAVY